MRKASALCWSSSADVRLWQATANSLTVFAGLAEETYDLRFVQPVVLADNAGTAIARNGIGWNSTSAYSGRTGYLVCTTNSNGVGGNLYAEFMQVPALGINVVTALEHADDAAAQDMTWYGTDALMQLTAEWQG